MVCEKLEGDGDDNRGDCLRDFGYLDDVVGDFRDGGVPFGYNGDDGTSAGLDLLDVGDDFLMEIIVGGDEDRGEFPVYERDGSVLHLGGGVAFGMDITDFLELEGAFESRGEVIAASQVEEIVGVGENPGKMLDFIVEFQGFLDEFGEIAERLHGFGHIFLADCMAELADSEGEHGQHGHLAGESLRGSHTDFGTDMDICPRVGGAGYRGADNVADAVDKRAPFSGNLDGGESVGRFS